MLRKDENSEEFPLSLISISITAGACPASSVSLQTEEVKNISILVYGQLKHVLLITFTSRFLDNKLFLKGRFTFTDIHKEFYYT